MKELNLYGYQAIDMRVKHLEMIYDSLNHYLENYLDMMEDDKWVDDVKSAKSVFASFANEIRRNTDQLDRVIDELKKMADNKLNQDNELTGDKKIKSVNNYELQKQYAGWY